MRYRRGTSRYQYSMLSINDLISSSNVVRVIEEICEEFVKGFLDTRLEEPSVEQKGTKETGRMAYHPADLSKILVYGYFHGINSSRKLERECGRNLELKWLTSDLVPDHKTISDFRRGSGDLVNGLFGYLISEFQSEGLLTGKDIAVDGSKIKGYTNREINIDTIKSKLESIESQVQKYLYDMERIDAAEDDIEVLQQKKVEMEKEIEKLASKKKGYEESLQVLEALGAKKISITDPDARMMKGRQGSYWGYNMQSAVDTEHHLITAVEVTSNQNDKGLLAQTAARSEQATGQNPTAVYADGGYYKIKDIETLESAGTTCYVGINMTSSQANDQAKGVSFVYHAQEDHYQCSEGRELPYWRTRKKTGSDGQAVRLYKGLECGACLKKDACTTGLARTIQRNTNQEWIDGFHERMNSTHGKKMLVKRKSVVEHPFGTMKYQMGHMPVLLRGKKKVQIEIQLHAIAYNLKRYLTIHAKTEGQPKMKMAA